MQRTVQTNFFKVLQRDFQKIRGEASPGNGTATKGIITDMERELLKGRRRQQAVASAKSRNSSCPISNFAGKEVKLKRPGVSQRRQYQTARAGRCRPTCRWRTTSRTWPTFWRKTSRRDAQANRCRSRSMKKNSKNQKSCQAPSGIRDQCYKPFFVLLSLAQNFVNLPL